MQVYTDWVGARCRVICNCTFYPGSNDTFNLEPAEKKEGRCWLIRAELFTVDYAEIFCEAKRKEESYAKKNIRAHGLWVNSYPNTIQLGLPSPTACIQKFYQCHRLGPLL